MTNPKTPVKFTCVQIACTDSQRSNYLMRTSPILWRINHASIYAPSDYLVFMRAACLVHSVEHSFFKDYESLPGNFSSIRQGKKAGDPTVTDVRELMGLLYQPSAIVYYKLCDTHEWIECPAEGACKILYRDS